MHHIEFSTSLTFPGNTFTPSRLIYLLITPKGAPSFMESDKYLLLPCVLYAEGAALCMAILTEPPIRLGLIDLRRSEGHR